MGGACVLSLLRVPPRRPPRNPAGPSTPAGRWLPAGSRRAGVAPGPAGGVHGRHGAGVIVEGDLAVGENAAVA